MGDASPLKQIDRQRVAQLFRIAEVEIADSNPLIGSYISLVGNGVGTELEGVFQMAGIGIFHGLVLVVGVLQKRVGLKNIASTPSTPNLWMKRCEKGSVSRLYSE